MLSYGTMPETFKEQFARGYQARRENRLADSRAIFLKAVRSASEEGDRPALAEALCGLGQAERDIGSLSPRVITMPTQPCSTVRSDRRRG